MIDLMDFVILGAATAWLAISIGVSLLIGRAIDRREQQKPR